jgi:hypothetical protein
MVNMAGEGQIHTWIECAGVFMTLLRVRGWLMLKNVKNREHWVNVGKRPTIQYQQLMLPVSQGAGSVAFAMNSTVDRNEPGVMTCPVLA